MRIMLVVIWVLAAIAAVAATVLLYIFIMPEKKAAKMPKFIRVIRDVLDMKKLYLETVLKAVYVFLTIFCVLAGAMMFFFGFGTNYRGNLEWYGGYGLLVMLGGPIVLRLMFEAMMMFILLVKNTMQINNKIKAQEAEETVDAPAPAPEKPGVVIVQTHE